MTDLERRFNELNYIKQYIIIHYYDDVEKITVEYLSQELNNTSDNDIIEALRDVAIFQTITIEKPNWNPRVEHEILLKPENEIPDFYELLDVFS